MLFLGFGFLHVQPGPGIQSAGLRVHQGQCTHSGGLSGLFGTHHLLDHHASFDHPLAFSPRLASSAILPAPSAAVPQASDVRAFFCLLYKVSLGNLINTCSLNPSINSNWIWIEGEKLLWCKPHCSTGGWKQKSEVDSTWGLCTQLGDVLLGIQVTFGSA